MKNPTVQSGNFLLSGMVIKPIMVTEGFWEQRGAPARAPLLNWNELLDL
ncbi:MAG: hypothetical protein ACREGG_04475 [Candidatus Saccharimonadales bacterium]